MEKERKELLGKGRDEKEEQEEVRRGSGTKGKRRKYEERWEGNERKERKLGEDAKKG